MRYKEQFEEQTENKMKMNNQLAYHEKYIDWFENTQLERLLDSYYNKGLKDGANNLRREIKYILSIEL